QASKIDGPRRFPQQLTGGGDITFVAGIVPGGSKLIISRDRKGEEKPRPYLPDPGGGAPMMVPHLPGIQTQAQYVSDDSRWLYYRSNDKKKDSYAIYRVDLKTLQKEPVFEQDGIWNVADGRPDGTLLVVKETGSISREIYEWSAQKK